MCIKKPYCPPSIDPCLQKEIDHINKFTELKTIASCCGHKKYPKSIFVKNKQNQVSEWFTGIEFGAYKKKMKLYIKDHEGYYFNPELVIITIDRKIHFRKDSAIDK